MQLKIEMTVAWYDKTYATPDWVASLRDAEGGVEGAFLTLSALSE